MSWSFNAQGKPDEVVNQINTYGDALTGDSRMEFDDVRPHIVALVQQNRLAPETQREPAIIAVSGYGSMSKVGDKEVSRECSISLRKA